MHDYAFGIDCILRGEDCINLIACSCYIEDRRSGFGGKRDDSRSCN
jgi:hypothetical protein